MLSNFGWTEFFFLLIIGLIVIGPERLPSVVEDVRAAIYAARKGIANAKRELNGELEGFEEFREPINTVSKYAAIGPRRAVSSLLFEGDEEYLDEFDPRRALADNEPQQPEHPAQPAQPAQPKQVNSGPRPSPQNQTPPPAPEQPGEPKRTAGFSWEDVV